jgi:hypothetical protein
MASMSIKNQEPINTLYTVLCVLLEDVHKLGKA